MCGRYTLRMAPDELAEQLEAEQSARVAQTEQRERYNVAPSQDVPVLVHRPEHGRELQVARWGLIPGWAKDPKIGYKLTNARAETVADKPSYRKAYRSKRALVPANGFYEWKRDETPKQPYYIHAGDAEDLFTFAGLYEAWRDPDRADDDPARWVMSCTIITTEAADSLAWMHNRMPAFIPPDLRDAWLDHDATTSELEELLRDGPAQVASELATYPVSTEVNSARNQGRQLIEPIAVA